jgi:hypothetical protein
MKYKPSDYTDGFTINVTTKVDMPDVEYINSLAIEKHFSMDSSFTRVPKMLEDLYSLFLKERDDDEFSFENYVFSPEYIEQDLIFRAMSNQERAYYDNIILFYSQLDFINTPGITPMDKSLNTMMYLVHLSEVTNPVDTDYDTRDHQDPTPENIEISKEQLNQAMEQMAQQGVSGDDMLKPQGAGGKNSGPQQEKDELTNDMTKCVRDHLYDLSPTVAHIYGAKKPADMPINRKILSDIKIKSYLENSRGMESAKDVKKKRNNNSNERRRLQMEEHSQLTKVRKSSMMMENFDERFVKKEIDVKEKVKAEEKKQGFFMLLDDSGSMRSRMKQSYVRAVLLNRLEAVMEGNAELKFALYESERYDITDVKELKDAQKLYKKISLRRPSGGGTYIGNVLQQTIDDIHDSEQYHDPEIMIVCDGDDHVDPKKLKYKGVKINVVLLGTNNPGLKEIAKDTGGFYTVEKMYERY